ncbi:MAG TPA: TatD family hydrolase [Rudaea sp.]|nr:TatD family hydrolase [Rudaea sp.]
MDLIDSHSHLDAAEFDVDRTAVLQRARAAGVMRQIVPAVAIDTFPALRALCAAQGGLYPAYGLHPMYLVAHRPEHLEHLAHWIEREKPVAVGECGLDFFVPDLDAETQRFYFRRQLEIARDFSLPVILHARRALDEVTATIRRIGHLRGVVHSFSGSLEQARQLWQCGFLIGLGGPLTYPRARRLRDIAATMPLEFLVLETDSPDQPLLGHQGARNEPALLAEVCACVAQLRGVEPRAIGMATTANAERLFALPASI